MLKVATLMVVFLAVVAVPLAVAMYLRWRQRRVIHSVTGVCWRHDWREPTTR